MIFVFFKKAKVNKYRNSLSLGYKNRLSLKQYKNNFSYYFPFFGYTVIRKNITSHICTYKHAIQLTDKHSYKKLKLEENSLFNTYLFYKNIIFKKKYLHSLYFPQSTNSNIKITGTSLPLNEFKWYSLINTLSKTYTYYKKWEHINNIFNQNILGYNKKNNNYTNNIGDITSGLLTIDHFFELTIHPVIDTIYGINIILYNNTNNECSESSKNNYLTLFSINKKREIESNLSNTINLTYETESSIISPTTAVFPLQYSFNDVLNALYVQKLSYFSYSVSFKLSQFFVFNAIVNSLLQQYLQHGISIPSVHFEIIVDKMTSFVKINYPAESTLLKNDIVPYSKIELLNRVLKTLQYNDILYSPVVLGITKSVLTSSNTLVSLSFQETFRHLNKLILENSTEWLTDIKSDILTSHTVKIGSGWYRHYIKT